MTDEEIRQYLKSHNYAVNAQDGIMDIFNTSDQILDSTYDSDTGIMTVKTPENIFKFRWILRRLETKNGKLLEVSNE